MVHLQTVLWTATDSSKNCQDSTLGQASKQEEKVERILIENFPFGTRKTNAKTFTINLNEPRQWFPITALRLFPDRRLSDPRFPDSTLILTLA